jgi:hypothetical protein
MSEARIDFTDILTRKFRYPEKGDALFRPSAAWMGDATLAADGYSRLALMTDGYKKGADRLVTEATEERALRDFLVYPIVFCYRHFVELSLKHILATYGRDVSVEADWTTHKLMPLWERVSSVLDGYGVPKDEARDVVESCIREFSKVDELSTAFRYPADRKGVVVPLAIDRMDLEQLRDVMDGISGWFTGLDGYLWDLKGAGP